MFEWDEAKNRTNIEKHGVSFEQASRIFEGLTLTVIDDRFDYSEVRKIAIGLIDRIAYLAVVHTDRAGNIRIISARPARKTERKRYDEAIQKAFAE